MDQDNTLKTIADLKDYYHTVSLFTATVICSKVRIYTSKLAM